MDDLRIIEALLFSCEDILTQKKVDLCFDNLKAPELDKIIKILNREYEKSNRSFLIQKISSGYRIVTHPIYSKWIKKIFREISSLEKKLIKINGRSKDMGKPLIYGITNEFLIAFGVDSISDLPKLKEVNEIINQTSTI